MHLFIQNIRSLSSGDFLTQLQTCFRQIEHNTFDIATSRRVVKITAFTACSDNTDYLHKMFLLNETFVQFEECPAPVSLVSQPPIDCGTMIEVWLMDYSHAEYNFSFNRIKESSVLHIECPEFSCLFSTHYSANQDTFSKNTQETFRMLDTTLKESGFDYSDIVRQWNYIENIVQTNAVNENQYQNYQLFNDLRSLFYETSDFTNGYPSATGIGTKNGGCTIEVIALKEKKRNSIIPITNSLQVDAHSYSRKVLVSNAIEEIRIATTPKFERAKYMQFGDSGFLFISGTASIIGEKTVFPDDVAKQTLTTFRNIDHLIAVNNLNNNNIKVLSHLKLINYRVYLKNESDYAIVKSLCEAHFGIKNGSFVKADICRNSLLVEIEANYSV